jgi:uncharacterized protein (TIRG00374 family)
MRRFLVAIALLLGIFFVIGRFAEVQTVWETLKKGDWRFISLAVLIEAIWLINLGASYQAIYRSLGMNDQLRHLIILALAANFANIVAPTVGMSGMAVFIAQARKSGQPSGKVTLAGVLFVLFDYAAFLCVLTLGLIVLFRRNDLNPPEIIASLILLSIAVVMAVLIYIGTRSSTTLGNILAWLARKINKVIHPFIHRDYLSENRAHEFSQEVAEGLQALGSDKRHIFYPFLYSLLNKIMLLIILFTIFFAFKVPVSIGTVIAGFSIGYLFMIVSPTPAGIGFVEGAMTLILSSFYIPLSAAAILALAFRGITFWMPLLLGFWAFRSLEEINPNQNLI